LAAVVALTFATSLLASCSSSGSGTSNAGGSGNAPDTVLDQAANKNAPKDAGTPKDGGTLTFGVAAESDGYDPVNSRLALDGMTVASAIYDPLIRFDENRKPVPYLAESVMPNADATVWTIKARPNVTFHDGTPFNGEAIKVNIEQRTKSPLAGVSLEPIESVTTTDSMTAQVKMRRPWNAYDYTLAAQGGLMISPTALLKPDGTTNTDAANNPVGTGPFSFVSRQRDTNMVVKKNPNYWQPGKPHLDGIEFRIITEPTSRTQSLESGQIDAMITEQTNAIKKFRTEPGYVQAEDFAGEESFVMLNMGKAPFDNANARKALAYATDRQALIDGIGDGLPPDANQPYVPSEQWYVNDHGYPDHDPVKAKEAVEQYKKDTGQATLSFELTNRPGGSEDKLAQLLQQQYKQVGIDMQIKTIEQSQLILQAVYGRFEAMSFRNFAYVEPDSNYIFWHSSTAKGLEQISINFSQMKDPELDAALDKARATSDPEQRKQSYATVVKRMDAVMPYIWIYHNLWAIIAKDKVKGLEHAQSIGFSRLDGKTWWGDLWLAQ
jgi:ABC-type transport system substrate-binding protein